jgi:hypothetical protein
MPRDGKHLKKYQFQKGNKANPLGAGAHSPERKAFKKLTLETYQEVIEVALTGNVDALRAIAENPNTPAIQVGIATAIMRAIKDGDPSVLERFAARIVGKIPDDIRVTSTAELSINVNARVKALSDVELNQRLLAIDNDV